MAHKKTVLTLALGSAVAATLLAAPVLNAAQNPFEMQSLKSGYQVVADNKGAEGKCGGDKGKEGKCGGDKAKDGKCGGDKKKDGKCGEGKCGGDKK